MMTDKIALKLLTHSDITLFRPYFEKNQQTKQKAINLNADIFVDKFYPTIRYGSERRYKVDLRIFGPGLAGEFSLQRKVIKEQKNWRLNGELVDNPLGEEGRFEGVSPGDLAIIVFDGVTPESITLYLLSATNVEDKALHELLVTHTKRYTMIDISLASLQQAIQQVNLSDNHPLHDLFMTEVLQDVAQDGIAGIRKLRQRSSKRRITAEVLLQARNHASQTGRQGEELINYFLTEQQKKGVIDEFVWVSDDNAISPYDFTIRKESESIYIDVKSTSGKFENPVHISFNELLQMRESAHYQLYRVYSVTETDGSLRISQDMKQFADSVLPILEQLPVGVQPDSISVNPEALIFEPEIRIMVQNENE